MIVVSHVIHGQNYPASEADSMSASLGVVPEGGTKRSDSARHHA